MALFINVAFINGESWTDPRRKQVGSGQIVRSQPSAAHLLRLGADCALIGPLGVKCAGNGRSTHYTIWNSSGAFLSQPPYSLSGRYIEANLG
jgi:hypothetical protein